MRGEGGVRRARGSLGRATPPRRSPQPRSRIDARYTTPTQHHNPIELFTTTCEWRDGKLTIYEGSQNMYGFQHGVAEQLGHRRRTTCAWCRRFVGGAFGSRGSLTQRTALDRAGRQAVGRPVKLVATREQGFTIATYRAETRHQVQLGATRDGKLTALMHEGWEVTSPAGHYMVAGTEATTRLYACPNVASKVTIVHADRNTPGFMRAPPETPYIFALEVAMDELAYALAMDPIELRRVNDTRSEPIKGLPYTSRPLMKCFDASLARVRLVEAQSQARLHARGRLADRLRLRHHAYPAHMAPATARVTLFPDGGQGRDGRSGDRHRHLHDRRPSRRPPRLRRASACRSATAIRRRARRISRRLPARGRQGCEPPRLARCRPPASAAVRGRQALRIDGPRPGQRNEPLSRAPATGAIEAYAENIPQGAPPDGVAKLYKGQLTIAGGAKMKDRIQFAFGAQFVEVRVHRLTGEIRVPRAVGAFAAGRIVNPTTARSQLMGGMIWGISCALHEATEIDKRTPATSTRTSPNT